MAHLLSACVDEFRENEDLPNTTNPDDWARISGKKGERIVYIRTLVSGQAAPRPAGRSTPWPTRASTCDMDSGTRRDCGACPGCVPPMRVRRRGRSVSVAGHGRGGIGWLT